MVYVRVSPVYALIDVARVDFEIISKISNNIGKYFGN